MPNIKTVFEENAALSRYLLRLAEENTFGNVVISFQQGRIKQVKTESFHRIKDMYPDDRHVFEDELEFSSDTDGQP